MVTGRNTYTTPARIGELQRLAEDPNHPAAHRDAATVERVRIDAAVRGALRLPSDAGIRGAGTAAEREHDAAEEFSGVQADLVLTWDESAKQTVSALVCTRRAMPSQSR